MSLPALYFQDWLIIDFIAITNYTDCIEINYGALIMASITIRQLDESIKHKLRLQAVKNGRSMEAEARAIFTALFAEKKPALKGLATMVQDIVNVHLVDDEAFPLPEREATTNHRDVDFSDEAYG
jgi:plasmid stability protein